MEKPLQQQHTELVQTLQTKLSGLLNSPENGPGWIEMGMVVSTSQALMARPRLSIMQYDAMLQKLVSDSSIRTSLTLRKAMLKPSLAAFEPESKHALKIKLEFLMAELTAIRDFFSVKAEIRMTPEQIDQTAGAIYENHASEISASAFVVFAKSFIANRLKDGTSVHVYYQEIYGRIDGQVILKGLSEFLDIQRQALSEHQNVDDGFIGDLPKTIREMSALEIQALTAIGGRVQRSEIRAIISNWYNFTNAPIPAELKGYILPGPLLQPPPEPATEEHAPKRPVYGGDAYQEWKKRQLGQHPT